MGADRVCLGGDFTRRLWEAMPPVAHDRYGTLAATMRSEAAKQPVEGLAPKAVANVVSIPTGTPSGPGSVIGGAPRWAEDQPCAFFI